MKGRDFYAFIPLDGHLKETKLPPVRQNLECLILISLLHCFVSMNILTYTGLIAMNHEAKTKQRGKSH